jgi:hypothetical protein
VYNSAPKEMEQNALEESDLLTILKERLQMDEEEIIEALERLIEKRQLFAAKTKTGKRFFLK